MRHCRPLALAALLLLGILPACRGVPRRPIGQDDLQQLVDSMIPSVERAAGLTFRTPPRSAMRTREQVRAYLVNKLEQEFPPERIAGVEAAYRLFGLLPDSLDLPALLLDLYSEQVAGFYDPDSLTLFGVQGGDPSQLRLVLAHELVHALQHQYLPIDSLLTLERDADRLTAGQAVLEGHATIASLRVLVPGSDVVDQPSFWEAYRDQIRLQQSSMPVFASAPMVLREGLIFPYLNGAEFMRWWLSSHPGSALPTRAELPASTEQVLFPSRYAGGDQPVTLRFADSTGEVLYEDTLGEMELQILQAAQRGLATVAATAPTGWGGDRYRVYGTADGPALVWYTVWDTPAVAARFRTTTGARLAAITREGYRGAVETVSLEAHPAMRVVLAPRGWAGWQAVPEISVMGGDGGSGS